MFVCDQPLVTQQATCAERHTAEHVDANGLCTGQVRLVIDGGAFESPVTYVAIALTLLTGGPLAVMLLGMIKAMLASSVRSL